MNQAQLERELHAAQRRIAELEAREISAATEQLRAEERWRFALEGTGDGVWDWNVQTDRVFFSPTWKAMLGYAEDEIGDSFDEWAGRVHPDDLAATLADVRAHLDGKTPFYSNEHRLRCKDGSYKWVLDRGKVMEWDADHRPLRAIGTHKDITTRKQADQALRQNEQHYHSLIDTLNVSLCRWLPDTTLTYTNERYRKIFGITGDGIGQKWLHFLPEEARASTAAFYADVVRKPHTVTYEHPVTVDDHNVREYQWIDTPILDERGEVFEFQSVGIDITERKRAEQLIAAQRDLARLTSAGLPEDQVWQTCFQIALRASGLESGGIYRFHAEAHAFELLHHAGVGPEFVRAVARWAEDAPDAQLVVDGRARFAAESDLCAQGPYRAEGLRALATIPIRHQGQTLGCLRFGSRRFASIPDHARNALETLAVEIGNVIIHQLTAEALQTSRKQLSQALLAARMGTWRWHIPTDRVEWSPEAAHIFGGDMGHDSLSAVLELFHPDDRARLAGSIQAAFAQKSMLQLEYRIVDANGQIVWVTNYGTIEYDADDKPLVVTGLIQDITERKQAEQARRESDERYHLLFEMMTQGVVFQDNQGRLIQANPAAEKMLGLSTHEMHGRTPIAPDWPIIHEDGTVLAADEHPALVALQTGKPVNNVVMGIYNPIRATYLWLNVNTVPRFMPGDVRPYQLFTTFEDITDRKQAESQNRKLSQVVEQSPTAVVITGVDGRIEYVNPQFCRTTGYSLQEAIGQNPRILKTENTSAEEYQILWDTITAGHVWRGEFLNKKKNGDRYWESAIIAPIFDTKGNIINFLAVKEDITDRKQAEQALRESEQNYRDLLNGMNDTVWVIDQDMRILDVNNAATAALGYSRDELLSMRIPDIDAALTEADINTLVATMPLDKSQVFETRHSTRDGRIIPVEISASLVFSMGKTVIMCIARDISERKQAQQQLHLTEQRYRAMIENAPDGIVLIDTSGKFTYASPSVERIFGYTQADLPIYDSASMTHPDDLPTVLATLATLIANPAYIPTLQYRFLHKNGEWRWIESTFSNLLAMPSVGAIIINFRDIHERRLAEAELRKSQELLKEAQRIGRIGYMEWSGRDQSLICSDEIYEIFDLPKGSVISQQVIGHMMQPDERERLKVLDKLAVQQQIDMNYDYTIQTHNGEKRCLHQIGKMTFSADGALVRMMMIVQDITRRKQAEADLRASEEKYRGLMESLDNAVSTVDTGGRFLYMNDMAAEKLGGEPQDFIGKTIADIFPAPFARRQLAAVQQIFTADQKMVFEAQSVGVEGLRWYRFTLQPIHDEHNRVAQVLINATDIHDLKTAQQELQNLNRTLEERVRERTAQVQDLYDRAPVGYHSLDAEGRFIAINQTELNWLGYTPEELLGRPITAIYAAQTAESFPTLFAQFKAAGQISDQEAEVVRKDGTTFPVMLNATAIYDERGQYVSSRSSMTDITRRKQAENELKRNVNFTNALLNAIPTPVFYKDKAGLYQGCNLAFAEIMGKTAQQIRGRSVYELWPGANASIYHHKDLELMQSGERQVYESTITDKDGNARPVIFIKDIFYDESGGVAGLVGAFVDITERKRVEETLQMANAELQRAMRIKDEFLASMSHELRTPLNAILGLSQSLIEQFIGPLNDRQIRSIQTIDASGRHLLALINDILDLSKIAANQMTLELAPVAVRELCEASLLFVREAARTKYIQVSSVLDPAVVLMQADERRLKQILVNLLSNAVKFTPEGGAVELRVTGDQARQAIDFAVSDTGIGIAPEHLDRLFQPFVQLDSGLNRQFEGTGLGLSLVSRMTELHGGSVSVESEPGRGSTFTITLPWVSPSLAPAPPEAPAPEAAGARAQAGPVPLILIAEDNESNIAMLSTYLQARGYHLVIARNGDEALRYARTKRPDLILMDLQMPVLDGLEATRRLRSESDPHIANIPVLALTALAMPADRRRALEAGANDYLSKPVDLNQLTTLIHRLTRER